MSTDCFITYHIAIHLFLCLNSCAPDALSRVEGTGSDNCASARVQHTPKPQSEEQQVSINSSYELTKDKATLPCELQPGQLVREVRLRLFVYMQFYYKDRSIKKLQVQ